jgi:hypothetical protein
MWVEIFVRANGLRLYKLCEGWVWDVGGISYPGPSSQGPFAGKAPVAEVTVANPAAGANMSVLPSSSQYWEVHSVSFRLVTDANVANRRVALRLNDVGSVMLGRWVGSTDQAASLTRDYVFTYAANIAVESENNILHINMPQDLVVAQTNRLVTSITNIQAGDQISNIRIRRRTYAGDT